jgi:hypothetical protein
MTRDEMIKEMTKMLDRIWEDGYDKGYRIGAEEFADNND